MTRLLLVTLALALTSTFAASCGVPDSPEEAAKEWLQAVVAQDGLKMDDRTCSALKDQLRQDAFWGTALLTLGQNLLGREVKADLSDLNITTLKSSPDAARVRVKARIRAAVGLNVQAEEINGTWEMIKENGTWKYCGERTIASADLPELVLQPNEVSLQKVVSESWDESTLNLGRLEGTEFHGLEGYGPQAGSRRVYTNAPVDYTVAVYSFALLFKDSASASRAYKYWVDDWRSAFESVPSASVAAVDTLGDEASAMSFTPYPGLVTQTAYAFAWRQGNVLLLLTCADSSDHPRFTEQEVRTLADKIQARAQ